MEGKVKSARRRRIVLLSIAGVLSTAVTICGLLILYAYVVREHSHGNMTERDPSGAYRSAKNTDYAKSDLEEIVGVQLRETETTLGGRDCMKYWNNRNEPTEYDDLRFYVFKNARSARRAFDYICENGFYSITEEGDCYVRGWLDGVIDADVEEYYFIHGNLIVSTVTTSINEMAISEDDQSDGVYGGGQEALDKIKLIEQNF